MERRLRIATLTTAAFAAAALGLGACQQPGEPALDGPEADAPPAVAREADPGAGAPLDGEEATSASRDGGAAVPSAAGSPLPAVVGRSLVRTARIEVAVPDLPRALDSARDLATRHGGFVASQSLRRGPTAGEHGEVPRGPDGEEDRPGADRAEITLRVPVEDFDGLADELRSLGRVEGDWASTEDVTGAVVDLASRIESGRRSIDRLRALLAEAETVGDLVTLESELSRREADVEALQGQLDGLRDQATLSTITLSLIGDASPGPTPGDATGFGDGLRAGLAVLAAGAAASLAVAGFLVPFSPALALVAAGLVWGLRRRARGAGGPPVPASA